jgi:hypothetical protein
MSNTKPTAATISRVLAHLVSNQSPPNIGEMQAAIAILTRGQASNPHIFRAAFAPELKALIK